MYSWVILSSDLASLVVGRGYRVITLFLVPRIPEFLLTSKGAQLSMIDSASSQTSRVLSPGSLLNRTELESDIGALVGVHEPIAPQNAQSHR